MAKLNGKILRELREEAGLTQQGLADRVKINPGTIHRLEKGNHTRRTRSSTIRKLGVVFGVADAVLTGDVSRPRPRENLTEPEANKEQLKLRVNNAARNALTLVARRFNVMPAQIVEVAPFLFYLEAERSLRARRKKLNEVWEAEQQVQDLRNSILNLPPKAYDDDMLDFERRSIDSADVFGNIVNKAPIHSRDEDEGSNPFATFLREAVAELGGGAEFSDWGADFAPNYRVCEKEAKDLLGDDTAAVDAVLKGIAPLHEMPREFRGGLPKTRAEWARGRAEQATRELLEALGLLDDLPNVQPGASEGDGQ